MSEALRMRVWACVLVVAIGLAGCAPTPQSNVIGYLIAEWLGTMESPTRNEPPGAITGIVLAEGKPLAGATVLVAERTGTPHAATSGPDGRFRIEGVPPGQYVPAAVAPGYEETVRRDLFGTAYLTTVRSGETVELEPLTLIQHVPRALPKPLAEGVELEEMAAYTRTTVYPPGAEAFVRAYRFRHANEEIDTLRVYLPVDAGLEPLPLLFMVYPTFVDNWEPVSVGLASEGYAFVAMSPIGARGVDIDAHAQDARVAYTLARLGELDERIDPSAGIVLGGSFSSPILHRFLRDEAEHVAAWVTVGGISNAFLGAADYYAGELEIPSPYEYAVPALGVPNLYPLQLLRYSPVYTAAQLPPTLIIHTDADRVTPINQAYALEEALREAGVPVEVFYYQDVSHYLQIGEDMTEAGVAMFNLLLEFFERYQTQGSEGNSEKL
jgi:acetyl esterase/lipase